MTEASRKQRNADKVQELYPAFRIRIEKVIVEMEARGFRPRIQDAWRSPEEQLAAFNSGHSKLKFGFHNVTGANGQKESLAVDILDDDSPLAYRPTYLLNLAQVARSNGLNTGISWGLPEVMGSALNTSIYNCKFDEYKGKIGWDPTHCESVGMTPEDARHGKRPI